MIVKMWRAAKMARQDDEDLFLLGAAYFIINKKNKNKRRFWVRPSLRQKGENVASKLLQDLREDDISIGGELRSSFKNFLRMSSTDFENLFCLIGPIISKSNTNYRDSIPAVDRFAITLRFLATGDSYHSLMYLFKVSVPSISRIVPEVCNALIEVLKYTVKVGIAI